MAERAPTLDLAVRGRPGPHVLSINVSIKLRLLLYFAALVAIPLLVVSGLTERLYSTYIEGLIVQQKKDLIQSSLEEITLLRRQEERISDQIIFSPMLRRTLTLPDPATDVDRVLRILEAESVLASLVVPSRGPGVLLIGSNGLSFRSQSGFGWYGQLPLIDELLRHPLFRESRGTSVWVSLPRDVVLAAVEEREIKKSCLYLLRRIRNLTAPHGDLGVLVLQLYQAPILEVLARSSRGRGERSILVDANGRVLAQTGGTEAMGQALGPRYLAEFLLLRRSAREYVKESRKDGIVQCLRLQDSDWSILQYTPRSTLLERTWQARRLMLLVIAVCLLIAFGAAYLLSRSITRPIALLSGSMLAFGSGKLELRAPHNRGDEIGHLQVSFNRMADDMKGLMAKIEEEHRLRRKLELTMLEYQINPHFLYNILDSINWMAQKAGHREIGAMVTALARFFRIGLSSGRDHITVAEELEHARYFLIISQMRYRDCFQFEIQVDESVKRCRTLKVLLQPILENTLKHGFEKSRADGFISISCRAEGDDILFEVRDNGRGMETETLAELQDRLDRGEEADTYTGGIGLINIDQRLRLDYGKGYGVRITSTPGQGTTVSVRIPREE